MDSLTSCSSDNGFSTILATHFNIIFKLTPLSFILRSFPLPLPCCKYKEEQEKELEDEDDGDKTRSQPAQSTNRIEPISSPSKWSDHLYLFLHNYSFSYYLL